MEKVKLTSQSLGVVDPIDDGSKFKLFTLKDSGILGYSSNFVIWSIDIGNIQNPLFMILKIIQEYM